MLGSATCRWSRWYRSYSLRLRSSYVCPIPLAGSIFKYWLASWSASPTHWLARACHCITVGTSTLTAEATASFRVEFQANSTQRRLGRAAACQCHGIMVRPVTRRSSLVAYDWDILETLHSDGSDVQSSHNSTDSHGVTVAQPSIPAPLAGGGAWRMYRRRDSEVTVTAGVV